jgi:CRP-like cAMP-binding protein
MVVAAFRIRSDERLALLRGVSLFSRCTREELNRIASLTTVVEVIQGHVLAKQGQPGSEFYVVVDGTAKATRNGQMLAELGPGSFFGELALLDGGSRTATVVADTDMTLLVVARGEFLSLLSLAPSVVAKMLAELGSRLRQADYLFEVEPVPAPPRLRLL